MTETKLGFILANVKRVCDVGTGMASCLVVFNQECVRVNTILSLQQLFQILSTQVCSQGSTVICERKRCIEERVIS